MKYIFNASCALLIFAISLYTHKTYADPIPARDTARVQPEGAMSVGIFNPLTWVVTKNIELQTFPLITITSPNILMRWEHWRSENKSWSIAGEYGLSFPTGALRLPLPLGVAGYLTPSCKVDDADDTRDAQCQAPGWFLVPRLGLSASYFIEESAEREHALTVRLDAAYGLLLAGERPSPLDAYPYLDVLMAPVFNDFRVRLNTRYDHQFLPWLRAAAEANVYLIGAGPAPSRNPWIFSCYLGADFGLGSLLRLTAGVMYWNSDQREQKLEKDSEGFSHRVNVRSHDIVPTIDLIWAWSL